MPIELQGLLEDVETFEGKNGFGANITVSTKIGKKTKRLTFNTRQKETANKLTELLDTDVIIKVSLDQNAFGLRFGEIIEVAV